MQNIRKNPQIAVAIYSSAQEPRKDVFGIQFEGRAKIISGTQEEKRAYSIYFKNTKYHHPVKAGDYMSPKGNWLFVKIIPKQVYYFDTKIFGENRERVPAELFG